MISITLLNKYRPIKSKKSEKQKQIEEEEAERLKQQQRQEAEHARKEAGKFHDTSICYKENLFFEIILPKQNVVKLTKRKSVAVTKSKRAKESLLKKQNVSIKLN